MSIKISGLIFVIVSAFSSSAKAWEKYCEFDKDKTVQIKPAVFSDGDAIISLTFPKSDQGVLHRIDLRYGNPEEYGQHDIYTQLGFWEEAAGYESTVHLDVNHKPLVLVAIYHFKDCFSTFEVVISGGKASIK